MEAWAMHDSDESERVIYFLVIEVMLVSNSFFSFLSMHSLAHSSQFKFTGRKNFQVKKQPYMFECVVGSKLRVCEEPRIVNS